MYTIVEGVRRAVAARELGRDCVAAAILHEGKTVAMKTIRLDELFSPKDSISRDPRYRRIEQGMSQGATLPPILVVRYVPFASGDLTPLSAVALI